MVTLDLVLSLLGLVFFALAAVGVSTGRLNAIGAGLFCWLLSVVV
jgi:hypothetical protein